MILNITSRAKTTIRGIISTLCEVLIQLESLDDAVMSSFDANSIMRNMAMIAPPTPRPMGIVRDTALDAAVVVVTVEITVDSILPPLVVVAVCFIILALMDTLVII